MLDFIKDIFGAFRQNSIDRIKSPFLGAFVFSWLAFNWQLLAIIFMSKEKVEVRLRYIDDNYGVMCLLFLPILSSFVICLFLPKINQFIIDKQRTSLEAASNMLMQSKIDAADKQLELSDIEAKKKLSDEKQRKYLDNDIERIKGEIVLLEAKNKRITSELQDAISLMEKNKALSEERSMNINELKSEMDSIRAESDEAKTSLANASSLLDREVEKNKELSDSLKRAMKEIQDFNAIRNKFASANSYQKFTEDKLERVYGIGSETIKQLIELQKKSSLELPKSIIANVSEMNSVYENVFAKGGSGGNY